MSTGTLEQPKIEKFDGEKYLLSKGWKVGGSGRRGAMWEDPRCNGGKATGKFREVRLKGVDGNEIIVKQTIGGRTATGFAVDEAVAIQRSWDAEEAKKETAKK